jgi:hypothetical protein
MPDATATVRTVPTGSKFTQEPHHPKVDEIAFDVVPFPEPAQYVIASRIFIVNFQLRHIKKGQNIRTTYYVSLN